MPYLRISGCLLPPHVSYSSFLICSLAAVHTYLSRVDCFFHKYLASQQSLGWSQQQLKEEDMHKQSTDSVILSSSNTTGI